jgi:kelch-like protein 18
LAATIPYFYAMFSQDYKEYSKKEIELKEIDANALDNLINFAYSGQIRIDTSNCQSIMIGASFLQLNKVRDACAGFLISK